MTDIINKDIKVFLAEDRPVTIELKVCGVYDANYGADADGRRGMGVWFLDDFDYNPPEKDDNGQVITFQDKKVLEEIVYNEVHNTDWDFGND